MKRFQFRLQRILRLKQQKERQAELEQVRASLTLEQARSRVADLADQLDHAAAELEQRVGTPVTADLWLARHQHASLIGQSLESAEQGARQAAGELGKADRKRARISTEVKTLSILESHRRGEHTRDAMRAEQHALDELSMRRWQEARGAASDAGPGMEGGKVCEES